MDPHALRLTPAELAAVPTIGSDPVAARALAEALDCAGLMPDGVLVGWADELLSTVARATLRMNLELLTATRPAYAIWATPGLVVLGTPASEGDTRLAAIDVIELPHAVVLLAGLRRRPIPEPRQIVVAAHAPADEAAGALLANARLSWRLSSAWVAASGDQFSGVLQVLDAVDAGLWIVTTADDTITFTASSAQQVWRKILDLLPHDVPHLSEATT